MSARKLGGGRILGSGKGLAPPPTPLPAASPALSASKAPVYSGSATSPLPSESTVSYADSDTPSSSSPLPDGSLDLTSNISLNAASSSAASSKLVCPICEEEMLTLLQLNRHIDDAHQELPEVEQDEVKSWFDKQVLKAKRFQPLSQITQKLRGLDVFESNETALLPPSSAPASSTGRVLDVPIDPDELITRKHWQRSSGNDMCTDPLCGKGLGPLNGSVNCRKCGRLFCEEHTMYQMRLSRSANHEPARGYWARVCETCYKSRDGYNDHNGVLTDYTRSFVEMRQKRVERQNLEISRLEKRLTKLTRLLANPPEEIAANGDSRGLRAAANAFGGDRNKRKALEQTVVTWEDDNAVSKCPFCQQEFGTWTFRRHHCRICGKVVCSDPQTACSTEVGLSVASPTARKSEKPENDGQIDIDVRMCRDCKEIIFSKRDFQNELSHEPPDQRAYETLRQFERGIRLLMPSFQRALLALQPEEDEVPIRKHKPPPTHAQIQEASKIRKRLTDSFTKYDLAARRLRDLKTDSPTQQRLQKAVYAAASSFLHQNMLPMKSVPRMLKAHSKRPTRRMLTNGHGPSALRNEDSSITNDTSSVAGSEASTQVTVLEQEEKELREQLVVLEEQRFMVKEMIEGAKGRRRFEEVSALTRNAEELDGEIEKVRNLVNKVEGKWEDLYAQGVSQNGH